MEERLTEKERQEQVAKSIADMKHRRLNGNKLLHPPVKYQVALAEIEGRKNGHDRG